MPVDRRTKRLADAIMAIDDAVDFVGDRGEGALRDDALLRSAVERQFIVLGEACAQLGQLDPSLMTRIPQTRLAIGMRNRLVHRYEDVDAGIVHLTLRDDLPPLRADLQRWLDELTG